MNFPEIRVFKVAETKMNEAETRRWLDSIGATEFEVPSTGTSAEALCSCAGRRCYLSFQKGLNKNVSKVRKDLFDYFDNILKSGHGSIFEHATVTFAIEGLTRVATGELNRHRAGVAISEGSMRYIRFDDIPFWLPASLREQASDTDLEREQKAKSREVITNVLNAVESGYRTLCDTWDIEKGNFAAKKKLTSMFRRIVPMGVSTGGLWTFNLRAMRHIIALRSHAAAEEEIALIFGLIGKVMSDSEPSIFGDFKQDEHGFWVPTYKKV